MTDQTSIPEIHTIAIAGGTGKEGKGLAYRWTKAGYRVIIGSRQVEKAQAAVTELRTRIGKDCQLEAMVNQDAAAAADLVVITVPYAAHKDTLTVLSPALQGKILVDVTVPLVPPKVSKVQMPPAGSASLEAAQILGGGVQVVAAFQNISFEILLTDKVPECDVLVCGTSKAARQAVIRLAEAAGLTAWDAGPLENSVIPEGMTSVLIGLNKQYGVESAGIKITGIPRSRD